MKFGYLAIPLLIIASSAMADTVQSPEQNYQEKILIQQAENNQLLAQQLTAQRETNALLIKMLGNKQNNETSQSANPNSCTDGDKMYSQGMTIENSSGVTVRCRITNGIPTWGY